MTLSARSISGKAASGSITTSQWGGRICGMARRIPPAGTPKGRSVTSSISWRRRWVAGSNSRRLSIRSPKNSIRRGQSRPGGKTSTMPPRLRERPGLDHRILPPISGSIKVIEEHVHEQLLAHPHRQALTIDHLGGGDGMDERGGGKQDGAHGAVVQGEGRLGSFVILRGRPRSRDRGPARP